MSNWIKVEDELPPKGEVVWCYGWSGDSNDGHHDDRIHDMGGLEGDFVIMFAYDGAASHWRYPESPCE